MLQNIKLQSQLLIPFPTSHKQNFKILDTIIKNHIPYAYYIATFSKPNINKYMK